MNELQWSTAYRLLANRLNDFYLRNETRSGSLLLSMCLDLPLGLELFPWLARFGKSESQPSLDPINVFASFNGKQISPTLRMLRYNFLLELLSTGTDTTYQQVDSIDFLGCPMPRTSRILSLRSLLDQQQIWKVFAEVMSKGAGAISPKIFDNVKSWAGVQLPSFTIFLFWIDSDHFIPLDNNTVAFLRDQGRLTSRSVSFETYSRLLTETSGLDYVELSRRAYNYVNQIPENIPELQPVKSDEPTDSLIDSSPLDEQREKIFKRKLRNRIGEFKMVALRIYKDTATQWKRVIDPGQLYQFSKAYDFSDPEVITYEPSKDLRLYNVEGMSISISALVGKNGSGKSSIIDLIYIALNNISVRHPAITDYMEYVEDVFMDFYYATEDLYGIELRGLI
ncbi:hypothetical protein [Dyadobacter sp. OTU695]|uniref:hypothetical protein n=1 Tax=Dyadobacter sp. OTU695 TaxID=3043860 RepID=UPI00313D2F83